MVLLRRARSRRHEPPQGRKLAPAHENFIAPPSKRSAAACAGLCASFEAIVVSVAFHAEGSADTRLIVLVSLGCPLAELAADEITVLRDASELPLATIPTNFIAIICLVAF